MRSGGAWPVCPLPAPCPQHPPDVILVPALRLLDDELCVEEHEAAHDHQPQVEVGLQEGEGTLDGDGPTLASPARAHVCPSLRPSVLRGVPADRRGLTVKSQVDPTKVLTTEERSIKVRPESRKPAGRG